MHEIARKAELRARFRAYFAGQIFAAHHLVGSQSAPQPRFALHFARIALECFAFSRHFVRKAPLRGSFRGFYCLRQPPGPHFAANSARTQPLRGFVAAESQRKVVRRSVRRHKRARAVLRTTLRFVFAAEGGGGL